MRATFIEGSMALMHAAIACVMEKAGMSHVRISREELSTAYDRLSVDVRQGVATGMAVSIRPKSIESTGEAPPESPTSYKPRCDCGLPDCLHTQAQRWRDLCEKTFGPGAYLAANIVENMGRVVALDWDAPAKCSTCGHASHAGSSCVNVAPETESTTTLDNQYATQAVATGPKLCDQCHGNGWVRP